MAKTIHTVLYDDVLEGSRIVTMDNCVCQLYDIKRDYEAIIRDSRENLSKPALYVLLNRKKGKAYIGETDDFSQRIASHMLKKEFWDALVVGTGIWVYPSTEVNPESWTQLKGSNETYI